ncbi:hypothetical protein ACERZ8_00015 [Tateyamaria armeniaca]|uniref:Isopropylmalate isomerase n=1 Tax=Tateyamaria armeniaca TaxID=2518930 RepID=A0ABW8UNM4_9RHOB
MRAARLGWHLGDPALIAGPLMVGYALLGWGLVRVARSAAGRERQLILLCAVLVGVQMINTPLDMHAFVWTFGRCLSHAQGWYEARRSVQVGALMLTVVFFALLFVVLLIYFRRHLISNLLIIAGVALSIGCALIVAISLHQLRGLTSGTWGPFRTDDLIEASGIALAGLGVALRLWSARRSEVPTRL